MAPITQGRTSVVERFLRYVTYDTQSAEHSETFPSTPKQLRLLDDLAEELRALGLADVVRDDHGYVMATLPATTTRADVPVIGLIAHVDTSPEMPGANVRPIVHEAWDGRDIVLPDDPTAVLRATDDPDLRERIGEDIITASGRTLLGADDKSGVASIMAAAEFLLAHPEIPRGNVRIGFTPDEEVGGGATHFDVTRFGAVCAYTLDGGRLGQIDAETFSADAMIVTFQGFNTHPGYAKGRMVNAIKVAADFVGRLPRTGLSPETTAQRDGFVHPYVMSGGVDHATVQLLLRDFDTPRLAEQAALLERCAREAAAAWPGASVSIERRESYRNMKDVLDRHPQVLEFAHEAIRRSGLAVRESVIRGGTDGSRLSYMGLPTPNLFTGQHNFHSRLEWVSAHELEKAVETIVNLVRVWEERG